MKEINITMNLRSYNHVVNYFGTYEHDDGIGIVMEYIKPGSLKNILTYEREKGNKFDDEKKSKICLQAMSGIQYLYDCGIVHGDIGLRNLLVEGDVVRTNEWRIKITDFGFRGQSK